MKTRRHFLAVGVLAALTVMTLPALAIEVVDVHHAVIHYAEDKHCCMPAFHGAQPWQWGDEDIGYTRQVVRPDGKLVTIYYWQEDEKAERDSAAAIWRP